MIHLAGKPSSLFDEYNVDWAPSVDLGHNVRVVTVSKDCHDRAVLHERSRNKLLQTIRARSYPDYV